VGSSVIKKQDCFTLSSFRLIFFNAMLDSIEIPCDWLAMYHKRGFPSMYITFGIEVDGCLGNANSFSTFGVIEIDPFLLPVIIQLKFFYLISRILKIVFFFRYLFWFLRYPLYFLEYLSHSFYLFGNGRLGNFQRFDKLTLRLALTFIS
jgi:hypothetical protein